MTPRPGRARRVAAAAALAVLVTGCGQSGAGELVSSGRPDTVEVESPASVPAGAEQLDTCPRSRRAATPVAGGLPDVGLPCLGRGPEVRMAGLRGEPRLVNVWASWCQPCRQEMPMLQALYADGVAILGVDAEDQPVAAGALLGELGVSYPSVSDPSNTFGAAVGITSKPITMFVAPDGRVVHTKVGPFASAAELRELVAAYLDVPAS